MTSYKQIRPIGVKRAKRSRQEIVKEEEFEQGRLAAANRSTEVAEKKVRALEDSNRIAQEMLDISILQKHEEDYPDDGSRETLRAIKKKVRARYE